MNYRRWTKEDVNFFIENYDKISLEIFSTILNRSEGCLNIKAESLGLKKSAKQWSIFDMNFLTENYEKISNKEISKILNRSVDAVKAQIIRLELKIPRKNWSKSEMGFLRKNYKNSSYEELSDTLNRSKRSICSMAFVLGLPRSKSNEWSENEIKILIENYNNTYNYNLVKILNRPKSGIQSKANQLGLTKDRSLISGIRIKANKDRGRDLTPEFLIEEARKYKTHTEFQKNDPSGYSACYRLGIMDEASKHMITKRFSIPQLVLKYIIQNTLSNKLIYNDRQMIKPYELDIYIPKYNIAFEYNGFWFHRNTKEKDQIKKQLCLEKNITLFVISETRTDIFGNLKNQFINFLPKINSITNKNITKEEINQMEINMSLIHRQIYDLNDILEIVKTYNSFKEFYKKEPQIYQKLSKLKMIDEATSHMQDRRKKISINEIIEIVKNYKFLKDFRINEKKIYSKINKNKLHYLIIHLKREEYEYSISEIISIISRYDHLIDFRKNHPNIYGYIRYHKLDHLVADLKRYSKK